MFFGDKPTELPSVLSGFTPAPDVLIRDYGYITALVWGKVWRYCQMADGVCRASIDRIANELGMSDNTIMRHLKPLCDDGYLYDSTPERRNKPHIYSDTGKIRIKVSVEAQVYYPTESHRQRVTPTTPQSHSESDTESLEESNKKETKKEKHRAAKPPAPPEITLYREVSKKFPNSELYGEVENAIQSVASRLQRDVTAQDLRPFYKEWIARGYNQFSIKWLEWAVSGIVPQNGKTIQPKGFDGVRQFMEAHNG